MSLSELEKAAFEINSLVIESQKKTIKSYRDFVVMVSNMKSANAGDDAADLNRIVLMAHHLLSDTYKLED